MKVTVQSAVIFIVTDHEGRIITIISRHSLHKFNKLVFCLSKYDGIVVKIKYDSIFFSDVVLNSKSNVISKDPGTGTGTISARPFFLRV